VHAHRSSYKQIISRTSDICNIYATGWAHMSVQLHIIAVRELRMTNYEIIDNEFDT
jgi:hypothetical protein